MSNVPCMAMKTSAVLMLLTLLPFFFFDSEHAWTSHYSGTAALQDTIVKLPVPEGPVYLQQNHPQVSAMGCYHGDGMTAGCLGVQGELKRLLDPVLGAAWIYYSVNSPLISTVVIVPAA